MSMTTTPLNLNSSSGITIGSQANLEAGMEEARRALREAERTLAAMEREIPVGDTTGWTVRIMCPDGR
jgi:hypothetical protein